MAPTGTKTFGMMRKFGKRSMYLCGLAEGMTKAQAIKEARDMRKRNHVARVVKTRIGYLVYGNV